MRADDSYKLLGVLYIKMLNQPGRLAQQHARRLGYMYISDANVQTLLNLWCSHEMEAGIANCCSQACLAC
jgi:hypothetical protein